jgi:hypothetical protein
MDSALLTGELVTVVGSDAVCEAVGSLLEHPAVEKARIAAPKMMSVRDFIGQYYKTQNLYCRWYG